MEDGPEHDGGAGDPAEAFEALRAAVAALRQVIEAGGLQAPDYSPDLGRIVQAMDHIGATLEAIEVHPPLRLTPAQFGQAMTHAGRELMSEVAQKYEQARQDAERERHQLAGMIGTVRAKRNQAFWLIALPVVVFAFTLLVSPVLLSELPFGLNSEAAASVMQADRWDAGWELLRTANPASEQQAAIGFNLVKANRPEIANCTRAAVKTKESQHCTIVVPTLGS